MPAVVRQDDSTTRIWTNATGAVQPPGQIVRDVDNLAGIVQGLTNVPVGGTRSINIDCEVAIDAASGTTFTAGQRVAYDPATGLAISTAPTGGQFWCGRARVAKVSGELSVITLLNHLGPVT